MSSGVQLSKNGGVVGTGADIDVTVVGFRPRRVDLTNTGGLATSYWLDSLPDASAVKRVTDGTMTFPLTLGITPLSNGFRIGADTDMNVAGEQIFYTAHE